MGLMDKAKGFLKDHEAQIQEAMDKGKSAVNKMAGGTNPNIAPTNPGGPVPNPAATDTPMPVQNEDTAEDALEEEAGAGEFVQAPPAPPAAATAPPAPTSPPPAAASPPPPPGPPMPGSN